MSFLDPYTAGDVNPDELNPRFIHYCVAGIVACVAAWLLLDDLMLRLVLAAGIIGLITAIAGRNIEQVEIDGPVAHERGPRAVGSDDRAAVRNAPLVAAPSGTTWQGRWSAACARHDKLMLEWLPYETDPQIAFGYPALNDAREETTAAFFDAMHDAQVLRTEDFVGQSATEEYIAAVRVLAQRWEAARRHAMRVGTDGLDTGDRRTLQQVIKLLRHADSATGSNESALYASRARDLLAPLVTRGAVRPPDKLTVSIEHASRAGISAPKNT